MTTHLDLPQPLSEEEDTSFEAIRDRLMGCLDDSAKLQFSSVIHGFTGALHERVDKISEDSIEFLVDNPILKECSDSMLKGLASKGQSYLESEYGEDFEPLGAFFAQHGVPEDIREALFKGQKRQFEHVLITAGAPKILDVLLWNAVSLRVQLMIEFGALPESELLQPLEALQDMQPVIYDAIIRRLGRHSLAENPDADTTNPE